MNKSQTLVQEIANSNKGFASKVAATVLSTGKCSYKQFEILNEVATDWLELNELDMIDVTNLKHDAKFEAMQIASVKSQSIGLR
jgi:hypothetical protein